MHVLELEHLDYRYAGEQVQVLTDLNFAFDAGQTYAIVGRSGAGKTTLLSLLSGLTKPTGGRILFGGQDIAAMDQYLYRSRYVGVIFQSFNLLPQLTAAENIVLSMDIAGVKENRREKMQRAVALCQKVELEADEAGRRVLKLSGGQQQRVAIARALAYDPKIILADEPTGNLDGETQDAIMKIFQGLANEGKCVIIVTHAPAVARACDVTYEMPGRKGK